MNDKGAQLGLKFLSRPDALLFSVCTLIAVLSFATTYTYLDANQAFDEQIAQLEDEGFLLVRISPDEEVVGQGPLTSRDCQAINELSDSGIEGGLTVTNLRLRRAELAQRILGVDQNLRQQVLSGNPYSASGVQVGANKLEATFDSRSSPPDALLGVLAEDDVRIPEGKSGLVMFVPGSILDSLSVSEQDSYCLAAAPWSLRPHLSSLAGGRVQAASGKEVKSEAVAPGIPDTLDPFQAHRGSTGRYLPATTGVVVAAAISGMIFVRRRYLALPLSLGYSRAEVKTALLLWVVPPTMLAATVGLLTGFITISDRNLAELAEASQILVAGVALIIWFTVFLGVPRDVARFVRSED